MTYNQLVNEIQTILESHAMIKTVKFASPVEWLNWDNQPVFPLACYAINSGGLNKGREQTYALTLWFLDKSGQEGEFETDVTSDQHGIMCDIINTLRVSTKYNIDDSVNWEAISDKYEDYLSGVTATFNVITYNKFTSCDKPIS